MAKFSKGQLETLWTTEGGKPGARQLAAAIALAESGGDSQAENHNTDGSIDRGLWQINSVHGVLSTFSIPGNTLAAISISSDGSNWAPWTTYKTGAYKQFMTGGTSSASLQIPGQPLVGPLLEFLEKGKPGNPLTESGPNPFSGLFDGFKKLSEVLSFLTSSAGWIRIGKVLVGLFLLLTGVLGMANISVTEQVISGGKRAAVLAEA